MAWNNVLEPISSNTVKGKVNRLITETKEKIAFREKEFNENAKQRLK